MAEPDAISNQADRIERLESVLMALIILLWQKPLSDTNVEKMLNVLNPTGGCQEEGIGCEFEEPTPCG